MDWDDLRHFLALARTGSVRAAGASLSVSHSTVLRRVEALEERLGARLFDRSRDGFSLTEAGRQMVPGAERVAAETSAIERSVLGLDRGLEGSISITCSDPWVADLILAELHSFCVQHPGIQLRVGTDGRLFDMSRREADIAIRTLPVGKQPPEHLIGTRVAPLRMGVYVALAHESQLDPNQPNATPRWAAFDDLNVHRNLAAHTPYPDVEPWGGFSSLGAMVSALKHGYGIGMLPVHIGDAEPELRRIDDAEAPHLGNLWLLSHPDLRANARLRACRQAIVDAFRRHAERFGEPPAEDPSGTGTG